MKPILPCCNDIKVHPTQSDISGQQFYSKSININVHIFVYSSRHSETKIEEYGERREKEKTKQTVKKTIMICSM